MERLSAGMLVIHGRKDVNAGVAQAEALIAKLKQLGKDVEYRIYDDAAHGLRGTGYFDVCVDFLNCKLSP